jgi:hypothetical protein
MPRIDIEDIPEHIVRKYPGACNRVELGNMFPSPAFYRELVAVEPNPQRLVVRPDAKLWNLVMDSSDLFRRVIAKAYYNRRKDRAPLIYYTLDDLIEGLFVAEREILYSDESDEARTLRNARKGIVDIDGLVESISIIESSVDILIGKYYDITLMGVIVEVGQCMLYHKLISATMTPYQQEACIVDMLENAYNLLGIDSHEAIRMAFRSVNVAAQSTVGEYGIKMLTGI